MKNLVVYKNNMNTVKLNGLSTKQMDLFFSICSEVKNKGANEVVFTFEQLRDLSQYDKYTSFGRYVHDLEETQKKLVRLYYRFEDENIIEFFFLFYGYKLDKNNQTVTIEVHKKFEFILNQMSANFTQFELNEFIRINSGYSKTLFRLLKQYQKTGLFIISISEFRHILCIPDSYRIFDIDRRILIPSIKELSPIFTNLKIEKIKKGRNIDKLKFTFNKEIDLEKSTENEKNNSKKIEKNKNKLGNLESKIAQRYQDRKSKKENF